MAGEIEKDATGQLPEGDGTEVVGGGPEVAGEMAEKERPVAALEAQLVVMDDHGGPEPGH